MGHSTRHDPQRGFRTLVLAIAALWGVGACTPSLFAATGKALRFDGTNNYVVVPHSLALTFTSTESFTLEAWINVASLSGSWSGVVTKSRDTNPWYGIWINPNNSWIFGGPNITGTAVMLGWHHVAIVQEGAVGRTLYVDGTSVGAGAAQDANGPGDLWIGGAKNVNEYFDGKVDEARIYQRALTAQEISAHYNGGTGQYGTPEAGLVAGWHFDEGSGATIGDYSGNGHTGTLINNPTWDDGLVVDDSGSASPYINTYTIGTRSLNVDITSVTGGPMTWTVQLAAADLSNVAVNDKLFDEAASAKAWKVRVIDDEADTLTVIDSEGNGGSPSAAGSSQATISRWYTTMQGWEDARDGDLVARDAIEKGEMYDDSIFTGTVRIDGSTTDATHYMWLTAASGERHDGTASSGATITHALGDSDTALRIADDYTVVEWLVVKTTLDGAPTNIDASGAIGSSNTTEVTIQNNIVVMTSTANLNKYDGPNQAISYHTDSAGAKVIRIHNNIVYNWTNPNSDDWVGIRIKCGGYRDLTSHVHNNTTFNNDIGFKYSAPDNGTHDVYMTNNIAVNLTIDYVFDSDQVDQENDYNASDDATATGANSITTATSSDFVSTTSGSEDLHLAFGSVEEDDGFDRGTEANIDIDGRDRDAEGDTWDMGADEFVSAAAPPQTVAIPTMTPNGGTFSNSVDISLATMTLSASIYYTTDGTTPATASTLYTSPVTLISNATVKAYAVLSGWTNSAVVSATFMITTAPPPSNTGTILREYWTGISGSKLSSLMSHPNYPNSPSGTSFQNLFEAPVNWADNYGTRMRGYVHPPVTGSYVFWISGDDESKLWLSTSESPANKVLIARVPSWSSSRQWNKYPEQQSGSITLVGGQQYYIEALQKEGSGGDNLAVGWKLPDGALERPIPGSRLSPFTTAPPDTTVPTVSLTSPTEGQTVAGSITVSATASDNIGVAGVQFKLDGADLGAEDTASPYSVNWDTTTVADGTHTLTAIARDAAGNSTTSASVTVTVTNTPPDTTPPEISITSPANGEIIVAP